MGYCGGFCNSNSNAADNCDATMGNRQCCSEVFAACAEVKLVGESAPAPSTTPAAPTPTTTAPGTTTSVDVPTSAPPAPTPLATPAPPAVEPEPEPESGTDGMSCKATPGLNRGVSIQLVLSA